MKKILIALVSFVIIGTAIAVSSNSVNSAHAKVKRLEPFNLAMVEMAASSPDSLFLEVSWTAGVVNNPSEPVLSNVDWFRNSVLVDSLRMSSQLRDTLRIGRAPLGGTDTIRVNLNSSYRGRIGPTATASAVFDNPDLQVPSSPVIISLDTTCAGSATCP